MQLSLTKTKLHQEQKTFKTWVSGQEITLQKTKMQDIQAFKLLYKQYSPLLYGTILRAVNNQSKAEAILQETFLEAWEYLPSYQESQCKMFTWLSRIAKQKCVD
ncbi:hypothetical protein DHW03_16910 [Pedobacter yonginense]|uniref:RNA polymerase sigma-70 region 2 domain-containing protein n=1 Tax=Pedobacter yonginense TaxID=651869 RepID=A0A317EN30_9SPHI|nr:sigma factor [Pedobacter yonginense]PWS26458.1 hypothetical protein DHW03_16910 [Pedobacter yonginense]